MKHARPEPEQSSSLHEKALSSYHLLVQGKYGLENPITCGVLAFGIFSALVHSVTDSGLLPALAVGLPFGVAAAICGYIWHHRPSFFKAIRPRSGSLTSYQKSQLFSIVFITTFALFTDRILSAQVVERLFGSIEYFISFLLVGIGVAGIVMGQFTALLFATEHGAVPATASAGPEEDMVDEDESVKKQRSVG
ncbi:MAG: hypothetical protein KDD44_00075 [Bdellovibrionales bacterium]|nr:hypothetical protein [Bdellovibrionales bacterium]